MSTWIPTTGARCWVKFPGGNLFQGQIIGKRPRGPKNIEWEVRYTAEALGFDGKKITQDTVGWFPGTRLDKRIN